MASELEKLQKLESRQRTLDARIQSIRARAAREERARETRRKILAGAYFIKLLGGDLTRVGMRLKEANFLAVKDEALFGLRPIEVPPLRNKQWIVSLPRHYPLRLAQLPGQSLRLGADQTALESNSRRRIRLPIRHKQ